MPVDEKSCGNNRLKIVLWIVGSVLGILFFFGSWVMGQTGEAGIELDKHVTEFRPRVRAVEESCIRQEAHFKSINESLTRLENK